MAVNFKDNSQDFIKKLHNACLRGMRTVGAEGRRIASELAPYDTGHLSRSIDFEVEDKGTTITAVIGTNVEYAKVQEFGYPPRNIPATHYLGNTIRNYTPLYEGIIIDELKGL